MKKVIFSVGMGSFLVLSSFLWSQEILDGVVAIVGDKMILRTEILQQAQMFALQRQINPITQTEEFEKLKKRVLQDIISQKVLLIKAKEDTVTVEDDQVEQELDVRIQGYIQQLGSQAKVEEYFGAPVSKIKRDYREEMKNTLIVQKLQMEKFRDIQVSRREVEKFYSTMKDSLPTKKPMVKLRHILMNIRPGGEAKQKAVARVRDIQDRLKQGEDFGELAKQYSEDPGTSEKGGDLGFVERGMLFNSFDVAAFQLKENEVSDIVETPVGLHLIQMVERRGDKIRVRHILIRLEVTSDDSREILKTLSDIRQRALNGEDFGALAKQYSDDATTKEEGGDLGWLPLEDLQIEAFKSAVDTMQVGQISRPFQTPFGFHVVQLEAKQEARKFSLEEDWEQIQEWALNMKRQKILTDYVEDIKKDIYIEIKEDML